MIGVTELSKHISFDSDVPLMKYSYVNTYSKADEGILVINSSPPRCDIFLSTEPQHERRTENREIRKEVTSVPDEAYLEQKGRKNAANKRYPEREINRQQVRSVSREQIRQNVTSVSDEDLRRRKRDYQKRYYQKYKKKQKEKQEEITTRMKLQEQEILKLRQKNSKLQQENQILRENEARLEQENENLRENEACLEQENENLREKDVHMVSLQERFNIQRDAILNLLS